MRTISSSWQRPKPRRRRRLPIDLNENLIANLQYFIKKKP